ncbi:MAG: ATP-dependent helicase, partial [Longimicrobiales bacterium]
MAVVAGYLERLNPEQREAVEHFEGPILALAGAGSGKTRVLTTRIAHLIHEFGVDPASILAVTFTNKAAAEMRERVRRLLGEDPAGMWIGTFHSIGARLLRRHAALLGWSPSFSILDADQSLREAKRAMERRNVSVKQWNPKAVHGAISGAKNQLVSAEQYADLSADPFSRIVAGVFPVYHASLKEQNALDFDDLLVKPVELFETQPAILQRYRERFQFILVDEYQDTNRAQYRLLQLLASEHGNLMVVGDDDQSIYGWRGADIRNILDFEKDFPSAHVVRLEQNYRSTGRILDAANHVISENRRRKGKTLRTEAGPGEVLTLVEAQDERDEADWITDEIESRSKRRTIRKARDFVVLYRTNAQSRALEEAFRRRDVPYQVVGGTRFYERREIMDVLAYLRLISNPKDAGAFDRIVNYPR